VPGAWRYVDLDLGEEPAEFTARWNRCPDSAIDIRDAFCNYFMADGKLSFQDARVADGQF